MFSDLFNSSISEDKIIRSLNRDKKSWIYIKREIKDIEKEGGALILDRLSLGKATYI